MNVIETTSLTKYYGESRGIIDINLVVPEGDFLALLVQMALEKVPLSAHF